MQILKIEETNLDDDDDDTEKPNLENKKDN